MRNLKLVLSYDGTRYAGWQSQKNGVAIQDVLAQAIQKMTEENVVVRGASRTDAGVHALGQVAVFQTARRIACERFLQGLNGLLPSDIRIQSVAEVAADFHPIRNAKRKHYRYWIWNTSIASPFFAGRSWHVPAKLDVAQMKKAAKHFVGEHDFAALQGAGGSVQTTVRTIFKCLVTVDAKRPMIRVDVEGNGFLRYMVRNMVGTLVEVGSGKREGKSIPALLKTKNRKAAGPTAPPQGLYLVEVSY